MNNFLAFAKVSTNDGTGLGETLCEATSKSRDHLSLRKFQKNNEGVIAIFKKMCSSGEDDLGVDEVDEEVHVVEELVGILDIDELSVDTIRGVEDGCVAFTSTDHGDEEFRTTDLLFL